MTTTAADTESSDYNASSIRLLTGLDPVRKRPGMYIGGTGTDGLHHLIWEIVDNGVDEAAAGHADRLELTLHDDGSVEFFDNGRGIPVDVEPTTGRSAVELVFCELHAGGKFGGGGYATAGGLHGVGASVVNALSSRLEVTVSRDGHEWSMGFRQDTIGTWSAAGKFSEAPGIRKGKKSSATGTRVRFWPDRDIFDPEAVFDLQTIVERARQVTYLTPGVTFVVDDRRPGGERFDLSSTEGIGDLVEHLSVGDPLCPVIRLSGTGTYTERIPVPTDDGGLETRDVEREMGVDIALRWVNGWDPAQRSFVNTIVTPKGGTHVAGFERALTRTLNTVLRDTKTLKDKEDNVVKDDVIEGIVSVVKVQIAEPQFEGQTKEVLGTPAASSIVYQIASDQLKDWFNRNAKRAAGKAVLIKVATSSRARVAARQQRDTARRKSALESSSMPAKLADCRTKDVARSELLIIEGDSAAGSAKAARDSEFQALLPIRGKILNAAKSSAKAVMDNAECAALITAIGAGSGRNFDLSSARYGRVVLMSVTADTDVLVTDDSGVLQLRQIGPYVDGQLGDGVHRPDHAAVSFDAGDARFRVSPLKEVIRHRYEGQVHEIRCAYGRTLTLTSGHSVFTLDDGVVSLRPSDTLRPGDYVIAPRTVPRPERLMCEIDLIDALNKEGIAAGVRIRGRAVDELFDRRQSLGTVVGRVVLPLPAWRLLAELRSRRGRTQSEMARICGHRQAVTVSEWERCKGRPTVDAFKRYLDELDAPWPEGATVVSEPQSPKRSGLGLGRDWKNLSCWLTDLSSEEAAGLGRDVELFLPGSPDRSVPRFLPLTDALCELMGWYVAEGSYRKRGGPRLALGADDEVYVPRISQLCRELFGTTPTMYTPTGRPNNRDLCFEVPLGWRLFVALVGSGSAREKSVPDVMFNVDQSAQLAFLAGLYLGDGTKGAVSNRLSFATSSRSLASGIGYLLAQNGVIASISERGPASNDLVRNTRESFTLTVSGADQLAALRRVWQDAANSELLREQVAYRQGVAGGGARRIIEVSADTVAIPIVDVVTRGFEGDVYDFSVADDESFVCGFGGGLAAHNTDADVDGSHIRTLLLTFFYHWMRPLLEAGRVYSAIPPLYSIPVGKELRYAYSDAERDEILAEIRAGGGKKVDINRYKGLGEMEADELAVTTMDVATRRLRRVALRDAEAAAAMFDTLMGSSVEPRRRYIVEHSGLYDRSQLDI